MAARFPKGFLGGVVAAGMFVIIVICAVWWMVPLLYPVPGEAGQFGDMFGVANALFSGLAFVGVVAAILLQRVELQLQREELTETRGEIRLQREQMEEQNESLLRQRFEATFFKLVRLLNDKASALTLTHGGRLKVGSEAIQAYAAEVRRVSVRAFGQDYRELLDDSAIEGLRTEVRRAVGNAFYHYARTTYTVLRFIDRTGGFDAKLYAGILRAQLSTNELTILFYASLYGTGREVLKPLLEKYEIFENLPADALGHASHAKAYAPEAFGRHPPLAWR